MTKTKRPRSSSSAKNSTTKRAAKARASGRAGAPRVKRKSEHGEPKVRRWSNRVTQTSNALDLEPSVFSRKDAREVAQSLKRSAERSDRRRAAPYRSAISMLSFYINRAGKNLSGARRRTLERAKDELRSLFGRAKGSGERPR